MSQKKTQSLRRVLDRAAAIFTGRRFESVSVTEIAECAHCSTATIYEVYGSKENLFLAAVSHRLDTMARPRLEDDPDDNPLHRLFAYAEARARWLAGPEQRRISRALLSPHDRVRDLVRSDMEHEYLRTTTALRAAIEACFAAALLRRLDGETIAFAIMAGTIYESYVFGLVYGDDTPVDFAALIRKVFTPLVSEAGARHLRDYLRQMAGGERTRSGW